MSGFWLRIAPGGCVEGSVREDFVGPLAEDAHREFAPLVADRRREAAEGWRHELVDSVGFDAVKSCLYGRCEHRKGGAA